VGHLLLPGQGEPLGQGVEHLAELERFQRAAQAGLTTSRLMTVTGCRPSRRE
jgi:hypothetical protein